MSIKLFPASILIILLSFSAAAWSADGRVLDFEGDVRVNGLQVTNDTVLNRDDIVVTGPDGAVKIVLSDNSVLDLDGDTEIAISDYSFDPVESDDNVSKVDVLAGTLRYVSGKIAKDDPQDVSFSAGGSTIGVRGTFISISVCPPEGCE